MIWFNGLFKGYPVIFFIIFWFLGQCIFLDPGNLGTNGKKNRLRQRFTKYKKKYGSGKSDQGRKSMQTQRQRNHKDQKK